MFFSEIPVSSIIIPDSYIPVLHKAQTCEVIRLTGVIMPITVKKATENKYVLVDGYERLICAKKIGRDTIPAVVLDSNETMSDALTFALNYVRGRYAGIDVLLHIWQLSASRPDNVLAVMLGRSIETVRKYRGIMDKLLSMGIDGKDIEEMRVNKIALRKIIACANEAVDKQQFRECVFGKPRRKLQELPPELISIAKEVAKDPEFKLAAEITKSIGAENIMAVVEALRILKESCRDVGKLVGCASAELIRALKTICKEAEKIEA